MEEWNEPTFNAREWRRAAFDVLGANGSWTWTKSSSIVPSSSSIVRATSIGSADGRRRDAPATSSTSPTAITRGVPRSVPSSRASGRSRDARMLDDPEAMRALEGKAPKKVIVVPQRIVNVVA